MVKAIKLKIIVLGPTSTGKTTIANFLSEVSDSIIGEVKSTRGVRIVEFQSEDFSTAEIELWDCSGDERYEPCWPVFFHEADGMVIVYAKESPEQKKEIQRIFSNAVDKSDKLANNTILFCNAFHDKEINSAASKNVIPNLESYDVNVESKSEELKKLFDNFIAKIVNMNDNTK